MIVLTYGDDCYTSTGYGQIWENFLKRWPSLKPDWKFYHVGWQNRDREHLTREGYISLPIMKVEYGFDTVLIYLLKYKPDILLTMADVGITAGFIDGVNEARKRGWGGRWFAISLFDTETWEELLWNKILSFPDVNIAGALNGKILMEKHDVKNVIYCPFGVDTKRYYPLPNKEELKDRFGFKDKFVVGFVGKNQRRKMLPYIIKSFSKFSNGKNDVRLLMHTDVESSAGWQLICLIAKFAKENDPNLDKDKKVITTTENLDVLTRQRISTEGMNEIYNLMDVFLYEVGGEGFGLPGIECQSAGIPLLMTDYSSAIEIVNDKELLIPTLKNSYGNIVTEIGANGVENAIPDYEYASQLLEKMYKEWKSGELKKRGEKARLFSLKYDWDIIAKKWIDLLEKEA